MTLRLLSTPTKILLTLEEVSPKHQEAYDDLMETLLLKELEKRTRELEQVVLLALPVYGGVQ